MGIFSTHRTGRQGRSDTRGGIALRLALLVPAVILLGIATVDLFAVRTAQSRLQGIAEAGALAGALALPLATDGVPARERAAALVAGEMSKWTEAPSFEATYEIVNQGDQRAIRVLLEGHRPSLFANLLPPGGWHFAGDATATPLGLTPRDSRRGSPES